MKKYFLMIFGFMSSISFAQNDDGSTDILFAGSSSTYFHNFPYQVGEWLNTYSPMGDVSTRIIGRSGTSFHLFLDVDFSAQYGLSSGQGFLDKIKKEKNDYVVVQQISAYMMGSDEADIKAANAIVCETIRKAGGEPVIFEMGWPDNDDTKNGRLKILEEAKKNEVTRYAPCSEAWNKTRMQRPELELHDPLEIDGGMDYAHPGKHGAYINFCCVYLAFTGELPNPLPDSIFVWKHQVTDEEKDWATNVLDTANLDPYFNAFPGWLKRRCVIGSYYHVLPDTAQFLADIAKEAYDEAQMALKNYNGEVINYTPEAVLTASVVKGEAPFYVKFDGSASFEVNKNDSIVSYYWNFGDENIKTTSGDTISHIYNQAGTYTASLKVQDSKGAWSDSVMVDITVNTATNIDYTAANNMMLVYPNPAKIEDNIRIVTPSGHSSWLKIYDMQGREIIRKVMQNNLFTEIPAMELERGIFIVELKTSHSLNRQKLIIQ